MRRVFAFVPSVVAVVAAAAMLAGAVSGASQHTLAQAEAVRLGLHAARADRRPLPLLAGR